MGGNTCDCVDVHLQTVNVKDEQKVMVKLRSMEYRNKINKKGAMGNKMYIILCRTVLCLSEAEEGVVSWWQVAFISWQSSSFLGSSRVFWSLFQYQ